MRDEVGLNQCDRNDDQSGLYEEGDEECAATESTHSTHDDGEDHGPGEEGCNRDQRLQPAPWLASR